MIYYHGTDVYFKNLKMPECVSYKDFGVGVYMAVLENHARRIGFWKSKDNVYLYKYKVNMAKIRQNFSVKEFRGESLEWIKYVVLNRTMYIGHDFDLVIGPTADNITQKIVEEFIRIHKNPTDKDYRNLQTVLSSVRKDGTKIYGEQICIKSKELLNIFNSARIKEVKIR